MGGIAALLLSLGGLWFWLRRRKRQRKRSSARPSIDDTVQRSQSPVSAPALQNVHRPDSDISHGGPSSSQQPVANSSPTTLPNRPINSYRTNSYSASSAIETWSRPLPAAAETASSMGPTRSEQTMAITNAEEELINPPAYVPPASSSPQAKGVLI